jgi:8-oxo-dGTP diphosphatase
MPRVTVAVGVIVDPQGNHVLIAQRADHAHQGGLWEFPGGKVESGESVETALFRELYEELAIQVTACEALLQVEHDYADKRVLLEVWRVSAFEGEPCAQQGQPLRWVAIEQLQQLAFPEANGAIVDALQRTLAGRRQR